MPTFMQKIRLALKGWSRRREQRDKEFLAKNAAWAPNAGSPPADARQPSSAMADSIDMDGLAVAYLDESGRTTYYLDLETGDVVEATNMQLDSVRYRPLPGQAAADVERQAFLATIEDHGARAKLAAASGDAFRSVLATDRALERAWYNFRNDRALAAIEAWLRKIGVR